MSSPLGAARRIVVKVGSALLVDPSSGRINRGWLETLVADLLALRERGQEVILVSSGAIALGRRELKLPKGALKLEESQAAAAVGRSGSPPRTRSSGRRRASPWRRSS